MLFFFFLCVSLQTLDDLAPGPDKVFNEPIPAYNTFMIPSYFDMGNMSDDNAIQLRISLPNESTPCMSVPYNVKYVVQHALWLNGDDRIVVF